LKGSTDVGTGQAESTDNVSHLIDELNEAFGTDFTVADQLFFDQVEQAAIENEEIVQAVNANSLDNFTEYLSGKLIDLFLVRLAGNEEVCNKVMSTDELRKKLLSDWRSIFIHGRKRRLKIVLIKISRQIMSYS
jgi:type I restriction enzyme R subunit